MDTNECGHNLTVLYDDSPGPVYPGRILFHMRHDGLETEANQALAGAAHANARFVTVGSSKCGHCLCLIGTVQQA